MLNSRTQSALKPQTLADGTAIFNNVEDSTKAVGLEVIGIPVATFSIGALGASFTSLSISMMSVSALGTTPTEMSIKGETSALLTTIEGALRKIRTDEPLPEGSKLVVGVTANGDTAVVAVNVVGECPSSGLSDGRI